jgi:hypothetical protein
MRAAASGRCDDATGAKAGCNRALPPPPDALAVPANKTPGMSAFLARGGESFHDANARGGESFQGAVQSIACQKRRRLLRKRNFGR